MRIILNLNKFNLNIKYKNHNPFMSIQHNIIHETDEKLFKNIYY